jgi:hypothetical protein
VGPRRAVLWIVVFAVLAAGGGGLLSCGETAERGSSELRPGQRLDARVTKIVDGDTIHVLIGSRGEKIRYIGVDTPETHKPGTPVQCYGRAASAFNARLLAGRRVELRTDAETRDRYGRLLAYVYRRPTDCSSTPSSCGGGLRRSSRSPRTSLTPRNSCGSSASAGGRARSLERLLTQCIRRIWRIM